MATDHGRANEELKQLASQKGVALPTDLDRGHQGLYDKLAKLKGLGIDGHGDTSLPLGGSGGPPFPCGGPP